MIRLGLFIVVLLAVAEWSCSHATDSSTIVDSHNKILFTSQRTGKRQLHMMNPDGSAVTQITSGQYEHWAGRWSPDAQKIVCNTSEGGTIAVEPIVVFGVDGSNRRVIATGSGMSWSPDGRKIAYSFMPYAESGLGVSYIFIINSDGTGRIQVTDGFVNDTAPCWGPDGTTIFFLSDRYDPGSGHVDTYAISSDGTNIRRITNTPGGWTVIRDISNDGKSMLVVSTRSGKASAAIYSMSVDTLTIALVVQSPANEIFNYARWSPDGTSVVFLGAMIDGSSATHIYTLRVGTVAVTSLAPNDNNVGFPDWSR